MDLRHNILVCNKLLWVCIHTKADYNSKKQITLKEWFQLKRYEVSLWRKSSSGGGYKWHIKACKP